MSRSRSYLATTGTGEEPAIAHRRRTAGVRVGGRSGRPGGSRGGPGVGDGPRLRRSLLSVHGHAALRSLRAPVRPRREAEPGGGGGDLVGYAVAAPAGQGARRGIDGVDPDGHLGSVRRHPAARRGTDDRGPDTGCGPCSSSRRPCREPGVLPLLVVFFLLGYFLYASLFAAVGAMCATEEEAGHAQFPVIMLLVIPLILQSATLGGGSMPWMDWVALFPFFSPIMMFPRAVAGSRALVDDGAFARLHGRRRGGHVVGGGPDLPRRDSHAGEAAHACASW